MVQSAWADDLDNDVDAGVDASVEFVNMAPGNTAPVKVRVIARNTDPDANCNLDGGGESVTFSVTSSNTSVATLSVSSLTFTACGVDQTITVTAGGPGISHVTFAKTADTSGPGGYVNFADFDVQIDTSPVVSDVFPDGGATLVPVATTVQATFNETVTLKGGSVKLECGGNNVTGTISPNPNTETSTVTFTPDAALPPLTGCTATVLADKVTDADLVDPPDEMVTDLSWSFTTAPADTTPPVITPNVSGTLGSNGWYTSDVDVTWTVTDPESTVSSTTGCDPVTIDEDTAGVTLTCEATSIGGTSSESVTIKRDATAPSVTVTPDRGPDHNGWYNADVTFDTSGDDDTSGIDDCTDDQTYSGPDGTALTVSGSCSDLAGNSASADSDEFDFDNTDPGIVWNGGPAAGATYLFGSVPAAPTCTATDATSGPDTCTVSGYSDLVGSHTMTADASDQAGNTSQDTRSYTVDPWTLSSFGSPISVGTNSTKSGSTVPIKFEVFSGSTELTSTSAITSLTSTPINCSSGAPTGAASPLVPAGGTALRYADGQFIFNWKATGATNSCVKLTLTTADGSTQSAKFQFK